MRNTEKVRATCEEGGLVDLTVGPMSLNQISKEIKSVPVLVKGNPKVIVTVMEMVKPATKTSAPIYQTAVYIPKDDFINSCYRQSK